MDGGAGRREGGVPARSRDSGDPGEGRGVCTEQCIPIYLRRRGRGAHPPQGSSQHGCVMERHEGYS